MSPIARLIVAAVLAAAPLAACGPKSEPAPKPAVATILTTPDAVDDRSYAQPLVARVTHVDLDLAVDFDSKTVGGTAGLNVLAAPDAKEIVLDTLNLQISKVTDGAGKELPYAIGASDPEKGAPMTVTLNGAKRIVITYRSAPDARALQWLAPQMTVGKAKPLLFSQGQNINNRSWIPTQDSPGIRQSWTARVVVPESFVALMSGERLTPEGEPAGEGRRAFRFAMPHPTAPYLIAIAVGDLVFRPLGERTGLYTEPGMADRAAAELVDTEKMMAAAEALYGPYRWGRYDVLVLPPAFPYGGMENTTLTFLTPTFITGDRANVGLVAHELAHSWSGNLVTNATWRDIWLNEGFTSYVENRLMEALYGPERAEIEADLNWDELQAAQKTMTPEERTLFGDKTQVQYIKGEAFLRTLEHLVGRERWDAYLSGYFDRHAFQPQTTAGLLADLRAHLIKGDAELERRMMLDEWIYKPTIPANAYHKPSVALQAVDAQVAAFMAGAPAASLEGPPTWTTQEWQRFLTKLPRKLTPGQMADLEGALKLNEASNAYVRAGWLQLVVANRWAPGLASLEQFLTGVGRGLFIYPLYTGLMQQGDWGRGRAKTYFAKAADGYHPGTRSRIATIIGGEAGAR